MLHRIFSVRRAALLALAAVAFAGLSNAAMALVPQDDGAELVLVSTAPSYLGVKVRDLDDHTAHDLGLKSVIGVEIVAMDHDAPAGKAGLRLRDVILSVEGKPVRNAAEFGEIMHAYPPDKVVSLGIMRDGKPMKVPVRLADRAKLQKHALLEPFVHAPQIQPTFADAMNGQRGFDDDEDEPNSETVLRSPYRIGATLGSMSPQLGSYFGVKDGSGMLVNSVEPDSLAAHAGLAAGDVILKLNEEPVASPIDWMRAMRTAQGKPMQLTILRNKHVEVLTVPFPRAQAMLHCPGMPDVSGIL